MASGPQNHPIEKVLETFWEKHSPTYEGDTQYMSVIFYHNEEQHKLALETKAQQEKKLKVKLFTQIRPIVTFFVAENYHQKFYLRGNAQIKSKIQFTDSEMIHSNIATKLNAYVAGYETVGIPEDIIRKLGLAPLSSDGVTCGKKKKKSMF